MQSVVWKICFCVLWINGCFTSRFLRYKDFSLWHCGRVLFHDTVSVLLGFFFLFVTLLQFNSLTVTLLSGYNFMAVLTRFYTMMLLQFHSMTLLQGFTIFCITRHSLALKWFLSNDTITCCYSLTMLQFYSMMLLQFYFLAPL